jgi:membrane AbrB-like protein
MSIALPTKAHVYTLFVALSGGLTLYVVGAPLPFLFGSLGGCLIAAAFGIPLQGTPLLSIVSRTVLGVAVGASITWSLLAQIPALAPTLLLVPVYVAVIAFAGGQFFHRLLGYDKVTAYYAAMPGALQDMVVFGEEAGGNARSLSLIHATRLLLMVTLAPIILVHYYDADLTHALGPPSSDLPIYHIPLILLIGIAGWKLAQRLGMFGASVTGPILLAIPLSLAGILSERPSQEMIMVSQFFIGIGIGVYYQGITASEFRRDILAASGFVVILMSLAGACVGLTTLLSDVAPIQRFLAFWPTGQAEVAILSLAAGANVGVVVIHHLTRIVVVILGAPLAAHYVTRKNDK